MRTPKTAQDRVNSQASAGAQFALRKNVLGLMLGGASQHMIVNELPAKLGVATTVVRRVIAEIRSEMVADLRGDIESVRALQVERLQRDLAVLRSKSEPKWSAIVRHEELLAKLTGTILPVNVNVTMNSTVNQTMVHVLSNMTEEDHERLIREQLELEAKAGK